ncbi:MAG: hypothetical protein ACFFAH_12705 [Promethearchaeota archaeon]
MVKEDKKLLSWSLIVIGILIIPYIIYFTIIITYYTIVLGDFSLGGLLLFIHFYVYPLLMSVSFIVSGIYFKSPKWKEKKYDIIIIIGSIFIGASIIALVDFGISGYRGLYIIYLYLPSLVCLISLPCVIVAIDKRKGEKNKESLL